MATNTADIPARMEYPKGAPCKWCNRIAKELHLVLADDGYPAHVCPACARRIWTRRAKARRG